MKRFNSVYEGSDFVRMKGEVWCAREERIELGI